MNEPIKSGDVCLVVSALGQKKSPNVGRTVTVVSAQGEHRQLGMIWRCSGDVFQLRDGGDYVNTSWADFAASWLQKVDKPKAKGKKREVERES